MKGLKLIYLSFILFLVLCGCQQQVLNDKEEQNVKETKSDLTQALDVREAVWEQLTEKQKNISQDLGRMQVFKK
ncbi:hypothetical protein ATG71_2131 [Bacillus sp. es.034]|nr:hypothetical protein ATG71_2131 [Bacillus sp. es.034]